ncbi:MAG TPA: hypothetical protein VLM89_12575 [Phycisphaerae bacterium]|nr:hypothetical protein [Phycisphaerae bacterium]
MYRITASTLAAVLILAGVAHAVVQTIDATVSVRVEQTIPPDTVNTDTAFESLGETTGNLPLVAEARLLESGFPDSGSAASTRLADPRLSETPDPAEFGLAALANSLNGPSSWSASGIATETREVAFLADEIGASDGTGLRARSYFFLDGVMVLWHQGGGDDLTGAGAEVVVQVQQTRGDADPVVVLTAGMSLTGQPGGFAALQAGGALVPENVILLDISELVPQLGTVQLAILPKLAIPYEYDALVAESFTLKATADARISSPSEAGAAVVLGPSVEDIAGLLSDVAGADLGGILAEVLDIHLKSGLTAARPLTTDNPATRVTVTRQSRLLPGWPLCGVMGAEAALGLTVFLGLVTFPRRSGR